MRAMAAAAAVVALVCSGTIAAPAASASGAASGTPKLIEPPTGYVQLVNRRSSKCIDVEGFGVGNGANVHQWSCRLDNNSNQRWRFALASGQGPDRLWYIVNEHSGKCLDVAEFSTDNGGNIWQWQCNGTANQRWRIVEPGDGGGTFFTLVSQNSGKCVDVSDYSVEDGANIWQWTCHQLYNQQFRIFTAT